MTVFADVNLSEFIVAVANSVSQANEILNDDPQSSMTITRFEVDTVLTATLTVPTRAVTPLKFNLRPEARSRFRVVEFQPQQLGEAQLAQYLQPTLFEAMLPATQTQTARIEIRSVIEAVPKTTSVP